MRLHHALEKTQVTAALVLLWLLPVILIGCSSQRSGWTLTGYDSDKGYTFEKDHAQYHTHCRAVKYGEKPNGDVFDKAAAGSILTATRESDCNNMLVHMGERIDLKYEDGILIYTTPDNGYYTFTVPDAEETTVMSTGIKADWLTAFGTLGLAIVAFFTIFRDQIREWVRHPAWQVKFEPRLPDCNRIRLDFQRPVQTATGIQLQMGSAETHWIRVRVKNVGRAGAEDIEVSIIQVRHKGANGSFQPVPLSTPWNLNWKDMSNVLQRLPVDSERHIDIGHVVDPEARNLIPGEDRPGSDPTKTLFCMAFTVKSNTGEYLLNPGEYEIDFRVFAANGKPSQVFTFSLNHTGLWFPDEDQMYHDGLGLSIS